jgi:hypothetical protein
MTTSFEHSTADRALRRRGTVLLGVAGGAAMAVLLVAVQTPGASDEPLPEPVRVDTAPAPAGAPTQRVAALDSGVDWSRVGHTPEEPGASVAAYDR